MTYIVFDYCHGRDNKLINKYFKTIFFFDFVVNT